MGTADQALLPSHQNDKPTRPSLQHRQSSSITNHDEYEEVPGENVPLNPRKEDDNESTVPANEHVRTFYNTILNVKSCQRKPSW